MGFDLNRFRSAGRFWEFIGNYKIEHAIALKYICSDFWDRRRAVLENLINSFVSDCQSESNGSKVDPFAFALAIVREKIEFSKRTKKKKKNTN